MNWLKKLNFNRIIVFMIYSDLLMISATGFLSPILAVFLTNQIRGGSLAVVGFATTIFWVVKSLLQIPVSWYVDKQGNDFLTYLFMVAGAALASLVPLLYFFFARSAGQVYVLETLNGVGYALMTTTWFALFTKHIDERREATEWAMHSNAVGLGYAAAAAVGGVLADRFGFRLIFPLVSALMFAGTAMLLFVSKDLIIMEHRRVLTAISPAEESRRSDDRQKQMFTR